MPLRCTSTVQSETKSQSFSAFTPQYAVIRSQSVHSPQVERLCEEVEYFIDQNDEGSFRAFLTLIQEQRKVAMQYIQNYP